MDCDHSACAMLIVFCSKLGDWCNLKEVRSDARCANKVNFPKMDWVARHFTTFPNCPVMMMSVVVSALSDLG